MAEFVVTRSVGSSRCCGSTTPGRGMDVRPGAGVRYEDLHEKPELSCVECWPSSVF